MHRLICFIGQHDADILPFFLSHYRAIGVDEFHFFLCGRWNAADLKLLNAKDVIIVRVIKTRPPDERLRSAILEEHARRLQGAWLVLVEANEFLELPWASLAETTEALTSLGLSELPATLLERCSPDGRLKILAEDVALDQAFPCFDALLMERMDLGRPVQKTKYPLAYVNDRFHVFRDNRFPHTGQPSTHLPLRGVLHHFQWHNRFLVAARAKGTIASSRAAFACRRWLQEHDFTLPTEGLKRYSRRAMVAAGYLIRPTRSEALQCKVLRARGDSQWSPKERAGILRKVAKVRNAFRQVDRRAARYLERQWLGGAPARIAIVTAELAGMRRSGGIGTAMAALAERLAGIGHEVGLVYCPFSGPALLEPFWFDYWRARGVQLHYYPRKVDSGRYPPADEFSLGLCGKLQSGEWDVIHFHELAGYAASALLLRAAGLAFEDTQIAVTVHGPTPWHRRGNSLPWNRDEALHCELEAISVDLADVVVCPSLYIADWIGRHFGGRAPRVVIPNCLTGETRRFGRYSSSKRRVRKIVFFGRLEIRKGIDIFLDAVDRVLARGFSDFEVILLGRAEEKVAEWLAERISRWTCQTRMVPGYANQDAIELLRSEDCVVILPSRVDNLPYTVYECIENGIPFVASDVGGIPELIRQEDHERVLVHGGAEGYASRIADALADGAIPARPRFDPTLADFDLLALHGRLADDARSSRGGTFDRAGGVTVIVHGPDPATLKTLLSRMWVSERTHIVSAPAPGVGDGALPAALVSSASMVEASDGVALNRLAGAAVGPYLMFCHTSVVPSAAALTSMLSTAINTRSDAVVCGYTSETDDAEHISVPVFGGPDELSAAENVYGARIFLVRKESFLEAAGFAEDGSLNGILEWEFLCRLRAAGKLIAAVPLPLVNVSRQPAVVLNDFGRARLAAAWIGAVPERFQGFMAMGLRSGSRARVREPGAQRLSPAVPAARTAEAPEATRADVGLSIVHSARVAEAGRNNAILIQPDQELSKHQPSLWTPASEPDHIRPGFGEFEKPKIDQQGRLLEALAAYVVKDAEDAEPCDFLVRDDLLSAEHCLLLVGAYKRLADSARSARPRNRFYRLNELGSGDVVARRLADDVLQRAAALTQEFYDVDIPLYAARVRIVEVPAGRFVRPPLIIDEFGSEAGESRLMEFAGAICLSGDIQGGEVYFPALNISVEAKQGRLLSMTSERSHRYAILRVRAGTELIMMFSLCPKR